MSNNRISVLVGSLCAAAGAAGLSIFGSAPVGTLGILMVRITPEAVSSLPDAMGQFLPAAFCALLLIVGLTAMCAGLGLPNRRESVTFVGRILMVLCGAGILAAAIPIGFGLLGSYDSFQVIATSPVTPKPAELQEAIDRDGPLLTTGYRVLLTIMIFPLLTALAGFRKRPTDRRLALVPLLPALITAVVGFCYVAIVFLCWWDSAALESSFVNIVATPKASELALGLSRLLQWSLINCTLLILMGGAMAAAGLLAPARSAESSSTGNR